MEHWINCFEDHSQEGLDKIKGNAVWQNAWMGMPEGNPALSAVVLFQRARNEHHTLRCWAGTETEGVEMLVCLDVLFGFCLSKPELVSNLM